MQLDFTPDQEELRAQVRAVLDRECPVGVVRALVEEGDAPAKLWQTMVSLDWPALTVPEACGGIGLGTVELAVLAEELGRAIAPGPLLPTLAQLVPIVREAGSPEQQREVLGAVARGECTGALALAEDGGRWSTGDVQTTLGDGRLHGTKRYVMEAANVDLLAVVARTPGTTGDDGIVIALVPTSAAGLTIEPIHGFDASRQVAHVHLDGAEPAHVLTGGAPALARAIEEATAALALEMVGTCQAIFDRTLQYAKDRHQFGVPIGSFQAVKHKLADLLVALERARATAYFAAVAIAEGDPRRSLAASMAKAAAGDAQRLIVKDGIQLHGGIGYMWENDVQLFAKRAKASELLFGTAVAHRARVASLI